MTVLGLLVNLACARILGHAHHGHGHDHGHDHDPDHGNGHGHAHGHAHHHGHDINLRSAYLHVIADAATSVLAVLALAGGWWLGWRWLDPAMGLLGAVLSGAGPGAWKQSGVVLLDREMDHPVVEEVRDALAAFGEGEGTHVHVWHVGKALRMSAWSLTIGP